MSRIIIERFDPAELEGLNQDLELCPPLREALHLAEVWVEPELRHQGRGTALVAAAKVQAEKEHLPLLALLSPFEAEPGEFEQLMARAIGWLERLGFVNLNGGIMLYCPPDVQRVYPRWELEKESDTFVNAASEKA